MKTYKSILSNYQPVEGGDFFLRYEINQMQYIVYSPAEDKIQCIELCNFRDITPDELAIFTDAKETEEKGEFTFEQICTKEQMLQFQFNLEEIGDDHIYTPHVSANDGVVLYDVGGSKARNLFEIQEDRCELLFDNSLSFTKFVKNDDIDRHYVCFNPKAYKRLIEDRETKGTIFLLASTSPYLLEKVIQQGKQINIYIDTDFSKGLEAFIYYYTNTIGKRNEISYHSDGKQTTISFSEEYQVEYLFEIGANANKVLKGIVMGGNEFASCYELKVYEDKCTYLFRNSDTIVKAFITALSNYIQYSNLIF